MKIKNIISPTTLDQIEDVTDDNIDVFVELEDGNSYTQVITTLKFLLRFMEVENMNYFPKCPPMIIVKELTLEAITEALESYCENDAYWLKEYYLSGSFDIAYLDEMIEHLKQDN